MTPEEKWQLVHSAQIHLGPVFPLWGVIEGPDGQLRCECPDPDCEHQGKHPRIRRKIIKQATVDPKRLKRWFQKYPSANYAVRTGEIVLVVDVDMKPGKDGLAALAELVAKTGEPISATVIVLSGRNTGSRHIYFRLPAGLHVFGSKRVHPRR